MVLCGGFADEKRAKKMRQDDGAEFISGSLKKIHGRDNEWRIERPPRAPYRLSHCDDIA